jgi:PhzF family phenazine biosynthesis protein
MSNRLWGVDAFAREPFRGNPAAVCVLDRPAHPEWMQRVAAEMNLSETAFVWGSGPGAGADPACWRLRWFTPTVEVALCGHATLASAHVLWESGLVSSAGPIRFQTERSGELRCLREGDRIAMDFPACPARAVAPPAGLAAALGVTPVWVGRTEYDYLCELPDASAVGALRPDLRALAAIEARGIIVMASASASAGLAGYDFVSRFFAPAAGVPEDPVTGSAHCALAPYWSARLGRSTLTGWQASARGGEVRVRCDGDRVWLGGQAVTVWEGRLRRGAASGHAGGPVGQ